LQRSLVGLVLVPVVGLVGVMAYAVEDQADRAAAAAQAADDVRGAVALDAVRAAVAREVVPVLGQAVLQDPAAAVSVGVAPGEAASISAWAGPSLTSRLTTVQRTTDQVIDGVTEDAARGPAGRAGARVRELREQSRAGGDLGAVFTGYQDVAADLATAVGTLLQGARTQGLSTDGTRALGDLQRVSRASALASVEVPLYFASLTAPGEGQRAGHRADFLAAWGGYVGATSEVEQLAARDVAIRWAQATADADAVRVDTLMRQAAVDGTGLTLPEFVDLATANGARDEALRAAVVATGSDAVTAAGEPVRQARSTLWAFVGVCVLLLLGTLVATLLLRRWIAAPLRRLAEQARAVRDGDLIDVQEGGPVEVRAVARGLAAAVDNLRRLRDQAQAVADGALDAEVVRNPVHGPLGAVVHASVRQLVGAIHDRERLQAVLAHQASHDALTELPNRAHAQALIEAALHRASRRGSRTGLLFVDLDHFKSVNDTHGHAAGDELLRVVGGRMGSCLRGAGGVEGEGEGEGAGTVARLGGDEFVVLVEQVEHEADLVELGSRIVEAVCAPVELTGRHAGTRARVGASIGVALSPVGGGSAERLLREADAAAYRAKAAGRSRVEVFDDALRDELAQRTELETALRAALVAGEFVLHYQPVLDLTACEGGGAGTVTGVEALVRWQRPGRGLVGPDEFIPVAESSDIVCDLGRWALSEAVAQLARWDAEGGEFAGIDVAVNVSGRHLSQPRLLGDVAVALAGSALVPGRLTLEITETVLVDEPTAREHLRALRALGVRVALDDFGTGYTSIGQLSRLPVDVLKIDRSFVASRDTAHADLVRLVIGAAHSFSLGVVAEGVEEEDQLEALRAAGCDAAQGFLLARPAPAGELSALAGAARG
jgi:diguanylate cyclase (GGDEF)-like protein